MASGEELASFCELPVDWLICRGSGQQGLCPGICTWLLRDQFRCVVATEGVRGGVGFGHNQLIKKGN